MKKAVHLTLEQIELLDELVENEPWEEGEEEIFAGISSALYETKQEFSNE